MDSTKLVCTECGSINRIPTARLKDEPKCGSCKQPIFIQNVIELTEANAARTLQNTDIPVLVDCWAPWCGPCRSFAPTYEKVADEIMGTVRFAKLNTESNQQLATRWNIRSIPTLILFKSAKETARMSGALPESQLRDWISAQL
ncbi:MAG: thioredoxin TrxC [Gammaproteobacteria bacterium]|nr:thioredoxin TrxC [Gammaproteobacteria bacterium]